MANYYATARSNYFRVKDVAAFKAWCAKRYLDFWTSRDEDIGERYAISPSEYGDGAGWPHYDTDEDDDFDFAAELAEHLVSKDVAILLEVGSEKLRYLIGYATAVQSDGRTVHVNLDEIYDKAKAAFGPNANITDATY
jgi:hypothetical protein